MVTPDPGVMRAALAAGRTHRGHTWPNPSVGCILIDPKTNAVIAQGCTQPGGRPHAEIDALNKAGERARGAIAYITLEPCNHTSPGKPVSCCDALANAGVAAVVMAIPDPDPRMAGRSLLQLRARAIETHIDLEADAAHHAHIGFITRLALGRPRVTLKLAHSRDSMLGLPGTRTTISSPQSWQRTFLQRSKVDAVMVGLGTVLADDPELTDRRDGITANPIRIIIDTHARTPLTSKLVRTLAQVPTWIVCSEDADSTALEQAGLRIIPCPVSNGKIDMDAALQTLGKIGLTHILCEGGATLAKDLLLQGLVDEALIMQGANDIGAGGIPMPAINLVLRNEEKIGADIWRMYDSQGVLDSTRAFFSDLQKILPE